MTNKQNYKSFSFSIIIANSTGLSVRLVACILGVCRTNFCLLPATNIPYNVTVCSPCLLELHLAATFSFYCSFLYQLLHNLLQKSISYVWFQWYTTSLTYGLFIFCCYKKFVLFLQSWIIRVLLRLKSLIIPCLVLISVFHNNMSGPTVT